MRRILALIFITTAVFAQNLIDTYRFEGVNSLIKQIEKTIQSKDYWLKRIKNDDVKFGYFQSPHFILFCNKRAKTLQVFAYKDGKLNEVAMFSNIIVGKLGDKEKEGDLKTPIGVYTLINKIKPSNTFYGPLAFVTSYPNLFDKVHHKNGYGIWIHGKPLDGERGDVSKGCIVLNNDEILRLDRLINYKKTTLEITEYPLFARKEDVAQILATLYKWRYAWKNSDLKKYISFYDKDFQRSNGMNLKEFIAYKKRVFRNKRGKKVEIYFKNIKIVPYQNIKNLPIYEITFHEDYISPGYEFHGYKEIYMIKRGDKFKILIEK
ncbi:L,D-transpeptidase family protein [Caminibacter pacificus]